MTVFTRYPVVSLAAEYLTMGYLLRRNILAYKAPSNNEGYDLICINPDPKVSGRQIRVQVKSRLATDSDRGFPVKARTFDAFDYLVFVQLNVGFFFRKRRSGDERAGVTPPEFYTFPVAFIRQYHSASSSWEKVRTRGLDLSTFRDGIGFEQIAADLSVPYPLKLSLPLSIDG